MIAIVLTMLKMLPVGDKMPPRALPWHLLPERICRSGCGRGCLRPTGLGYEEATTIEDKESAVAFSSCRAAANREGATETEGERLQGQGAPHGECPVREQQESGRLTAA